jgi:hypothetical protein
MLPPMTTETRSVGPTVIKLDSMPLTPEAAVGVYQVLMESIEEVGGCECTDWLVCARWLRAKRHLLSLDDARRLQLDELDARLAKFDPKGFQLRLDELERVADAASR